MQKLQCELCGSVDFERTNDGFFQCQHCGCKYTLEQAKSLIGSVETTIGNAELNRRVENAKAQMKLGQSPQHTIESIIKDYPASWQGYWLHIENCFRMIFESNNFYPQFRMDYLDVLRKIARESSEISEKQVHDMWDSNFKKIHDAIMDGKMGFSPEYLRNYSRLASIYTQSKVNAEKLNESNIHYKVIPQYPSVYFYYFGSSNSSQGRMTHAINSNIFANAYDGCENAPGYRGPLITAASIPGIIRSAKSDTLRYITREKKCVCCGGIVSKQLLASGYKCKSCNTIFDL